MEASINFLILLLLIANNSKSFLIGRKSTGKIIPTLNAASNKIEDAVLDRILEVAIDASKKAGDIILGNSGGAEVTERKSNSRDLLTSIDPACEKVRFASQIVKQFLLCILNEESVPL
jgi:hypothetical protein